MHFLYTIQYRYSEDPVSSDETRHYFSNNAMNMLQLSLEGQDIEVIDLVAFHLTNKTGEIARAIKLYPPNPHTFTHIL
jgi:uridylate kinase